MFLTGLEVLEEDVNGLGLLTEVLDDDAGASDDFVGVILTVDLAETGPLSEVLGIQEFDEVDVVLGAESPTNLMYSFSVQVSTRTAIWS
ncbi:hypothetical protein BGZ72_002561 [Mortierella alpina]|nr:hypothetical protein BGZ72_002561 [Mortierella alpina]